MLSIRLSRQGTKKKAFYRLIITEKSRDPWGKFLENLGTYNPHTKAATFKADRIKYWLSQGAQATATVHNLLISQNIIQGEKVRASKSRPGKKKSAQSALKKAEEGKKKAAEATVKITEETAPTKEVKEEVRPEEVKPEEKVRIEEAEATAKEVEAKAEEPKPKEATAEEPAEETTQASQHN